MAWRRFPVASIWIEIEEIQDERENLLYSLSPGGQVHPEEFSQLVIPVFQQKFRVYTRNHDDVMNIMGDLPSVKKNTISLQLPIPGILEMVCLRGHG
jgi:hypothetical protein